MPEASVSCSARTDSSLHLRFGEKSKGIEMILFFNLNINIKDTVSYNIIQIPFYNK